MPLLAILPLDVYERFREWLRRRRRMLLSSSVGSLSAKRAYTHRFVLPSAELRRTWEPYAACR